MRASFIFAAAAAPLFILQLEGCSKAVAQTEAPKAQAQRAVELTVYANDFALVHEKRPVTLQTGEQRVQLTDVSKQLDPRSVMLDWADSPDLPAPSSNSYDLGVSNGSELMKRYLGQQVELVRYGENGAEADRQKGTLMVSNSGETVIQTGDKFLINPPGTIEAPTQSDIVTIPQLSVQVDSPRAVDANLDVSYLTRGLSWGADYVAELLPSDDAISLQCWATVTNKTGTTFPKAKVTLMAGQPNRSAQVAEDETLADGTVMYGESRGSLVAGVRLNTSSPLARKNVSLEPVGDLQAYAIAKSSDIVQDQMNRLMLLSSERVRIVKEYRATLPDLSEYGYYGDGPDQSRGIVQMAFHFLNNEKAGLGTALPAGNLRVYGEDKSGSKRYLGAADVWNAPKDAKVDVTLANAFDLYTTRKVSAAKRIDKRTVRKTVEVTVHNAKAADADILVFQGYSGKFRLVEESVKHDSPDASTARWKVHVPAGKETVLKFTADMSG